MTDDYVSNVIDTFKLQDTIDYISDSKREGAKAGRTMLVLIGIYENYFSEKNRGKKIFIHHCLRKLVTSHPKGEIFDRSMEITKKKKMRFCKII